MAGFGLNRGEDAAVGVGEVGGHLLLGLLQNSVARGDIGRHHVAQPLPGRPHKTSLFGTGRNQPTRLRQFSDYST
jgi:hypothetical protein